MGQEDQMQMEPSHEAKARAAELEQYIEIEVTCIEPSNKEVRRNSNDTGYWQTLANLRIKITQRQTGIVLFPEFNAMMGRFKADGRDWGVIVNADNSMTIEATGRSFNKTHPSDELHALLYVKSLEEYATNGYSVMSQQTAVADLTGRSPSEIMNLVKKSMQRADSISSMPTEKPAGDIRKQVAAESEETSESEEDEESLPMG